MKLNSELLDTTAMVPQPFQLWQANAGEDGTPVVQTAEESEGANIADPPEPPPEEQKQEEALDFDGVFEALSQGKDPPEKSPAKEGEAEPEVKGALPDPKDVAAGKDGQGETPAPKATPKPAKAAAATPPAAQGGLSDDALKQFGEIMKGFQPKAEPEKKAEAPPAVSPYNDDEKALIKAYMEEWPELEAPQALIRGREHQATVQHIFDQLGPVFAKQQETINYLASQLHQQQLQTQVPDLNDVHQPVLDWIETQPDFLKAAYSQVAERGTPQQVAMMVERFKQETGQTIQAKATPAVAAAAKTVAAQAAPKATPKQVAALRAPASSRTEPKTNGVAKEDFDGAFDQAMAELAQRAA